MHGHYTRGFVIRYRSLYKVQNSALKARGVLYGGPVKPGWRPYNRWDRYDSSKKHRDQNDCMETVRSAIAEIEHFLSQRSYSNRDHCDATRAERTVSIQSF